MPARHPPFPLEESFSSKMTRCPSRLDMGAPRSRGSFSPLYRQRQGTESLRPELSGQLPVVQPREQGCPRLHGATGQGTPGPAALEGCLRELLRCPAPGACGQSQTPDMEREFKPC